MPNKRIDISKKVAYDVKEASNPSLSQKCTKNIMQDNAQAGLHADNPMKMSGSYGPPAYGQPHMYGRPEMNGQPHMESNKQEKYNLMNNNPVAKHASNSWLSKHMK